MGRFMSYLILFSPFISSFILFLGIKYDCIPVIVFGSLLMLLSMLMVLSDCNKGLIEEIERANKPIL